MHLNKVLAGMLIAGIASQASAAIVIDMVENGPNVVATGSGTANTAALTYGFDGPMGPSFDGDYFRIGSIVASAGNWGTFGEITEPLDARGAGPMPTYATSGTGDAFGIDAFVLRLPKDYVSGTFLSGTATWNNTTLAGLMANPGTYVWTWGSGATADSLTLNIGPVSVSPVPEPGTWALMAAGLGVIGFGARRKKANATTTA